MTDDRVFAWKQCLVVRTDVKMSCGKMCAQVAHAAVSAFQRAGEEAQESWLSEGQKKVVLKARDERTLHEVRMLADARGIPAALIEDAGMTELPPGTITALGLGPARTEELDRITSSYPLL
ncbi:MAG: peptidyl-tRNA hydrolase Pth2 [Methanomicrobiales archaeon]|nr:peptidyl-tRNA hydrolase Pth2 [Methanomicrobiales archaeon]